MYWLRILTNFAIILRKLIALSTLNILWLDFLCLLGCNNETPTAPKYCSLYGRGHPAPKLIHSHRIFIKVL